MQKITIKRLVAYFIDALIITLLIMAISSATYIQKKNDKSVNTSEELNELYKSYTDKKITLEEYTSKGIDLQYKLSKYQTTSNVVTIIVYIAYFTIFQWLNNGQTIGKKIMKIQTISNNGNKLNIFNYLIRTLLLYGTLITIVNTSLVYVLSKTSYFYASGIIQLIGSVIFYIIAFTIIFRKDNRGLHDIISNTKIIYIGEDLKENIEEKVQEESQKEEKIVEASFAPTKKKVNLKKVKVKTANKRKTKKASEEEIKNVTK